MYVDPQPQDVYPHSHDIYVASSSGPRLPILVNGSYIQRPDTISVIDTTKNVVKQTIPVGKDPKYIYSDYIAGFPWENLYIANSGSNNISVIEITQPPPLAIRVNMSPSHILSYSDVSYGTKNEYNLPLNNETKYIVKQTIPVGKDPEFISGIPTFILSSISKDKDLANLNIPNLVSS